MDSKPPIGQDLADEYPEKYGGRRVGTRVPDTCIICGAPEGSCSPHGGQELSMEDLPLIGRARDMAAPTLSNRRREDPVPEGFRQGEGDTIVCVEDLWVSFYPPRTKTASTVLVFHAGQVTTREDVEKRQAFYGQSTPMETK